MASNHFNGLQPGPDPDPDLWDPLRLNRSGISWNIHVVFLPSLTESLAQVVVSQEPGLEKEPESQGRGGLQTFKALCAYLCPRTDNLATQKTKTEAVRSPEGSLRSAGCVSVCCHQGPEGALGSQHFLTPSPSPTPPPDPPASLSAGPHTPLSARQLPSA